MGVQVIHADCYEWMREQPDNSVDLVLGSPPYEAARTYGIGFALRGQDWSDWMVERMVEMVRICRGMVCMVVEGQTRNYRWSAAPVLLMADLHRRGIHLRKPPIYQRVGIPGSGGPDWWRNDYEFVICCSKGGKLPWSENTATGMPPKCAPGGAMSYRVSDGTRVNQRGGRTGIGQKADGTIERKPRPSHRVYTKKDGTQVLRENRQVMTREREGTKQQSQDGYTVPAIANPGNVIKCKVGGGLMGSKLSHENEAPFPETLVEPFIRCFCPPGGIVLDPFCGSGTTLAVAKQWNRNAIGIDIRESQVELTRRRIEQVQTRLAV